MITWYEWLMLLAVPSILFMLFQLGFNFAVNKRKKKHHEDDTVKLGVQALLRNELVRGYYQYKAQGWIEISDKQNYDNMYIRYHNLGKNGVMDQMYAEIMKLPTTPVNR